MSKRSRSLIWSALLVVGFVGCGGGGGSPPPAEVQAKEGKEIEDMQKSRIEYNKKVKR